MFQPACSKVKSMEFHYIYFYDYYSISKHQFFNVCKLLNFINFFHTFLLCFFHFSYLDENLCSHMLALEYFAESIESDIGFYGLKCASYFQYVFGWCNLKQKIRNKLRNIERVLMGENCEKT